MPIYEYRCQACGAELEKLQKISDPVLVECPECGKDSLVKLMSASSFRLKGGGWYETDFKTGKKKNGVGDQESASADGAAGKAAESAGEGKTSAASGSSDGQSAAGGASAAKKEDAAKPASKPGGSGSQSAAV